MKPDEIDETTDPRWHRRTCARLEIEDASGPLTLGQKWRRLLGRRKSKAPSSQDACPAQGRPDPDDLPEDP